MAALTKAKPRREEIWKYRRFVLASGTKAFKNGGAVFDQSAGKMVPATTGQTDLFTLGLFAEDVDATAADKLCNVELKREVRGRWFANDGTNPVLITDLGKPTYWVDDDTVSILATSRSVAGIAWAIDTDKGVFVEMS